MNKTIKQGNSKKIDNLRAEWLERASIIVRLYEEVWYLETQPIRKGLGRLRITIQKLAEKQIALEQEIQKHFQDKIEYIYNQNQIHRPPQ